jgi:Flp pilus assembly secretin CpaC
MNLTRIVQPAAAGAMVLAVISVVAIHEALAQEPKSVQSSPVQAVTGSVQEITLTMGKGGFFKTSTPYSKLSVADDKIVEVTPHSDREFIFNPKGIGSTNVFVFDEKNTLIARLDINVVGGTAGAPEVREETYGGRVRVYNRIYNDKGELARPAFYRCNGTNCESEREAPNLGPGPTGMTAASPREDGTAEKGSPQ